MRKMSIIRLDNKGQISAEYLLLFAAIMAILLFVTIPFAEKTVNANNNVTAVSDTKIVVEGIANAVNIVYANGPGSKRTLNVEVPRDMNLTFDSTGHRVNTTVNGLSYTGPDGTPATSKSVAAPINYYGNINTLTLTKGSHTVQIYWNNTVNPAVFQVKQTY